MSRFLTELDVELRDDDSVWVTRNPLLYESDLAGMIEVPAGFYTDFASVPRVPVAYAFFGDRAHRESVIHDYLFRKDAVPNVSFMTANRVFLEAMKLRGKSFLIRYPMYWGVCLGSIFCFHVKRVADSI